MSKGTRKNKQRIQVLTHKGARAKDEVVKKFTIIKEGKKNLFIN